MNKPKLTALFVVLITMLIAVASFLLPLPPNSGWWEFHSFLAVTIVVTLILIGSSIVSFEGLNGFAPKLKQAYFLIFLGMILLGIALLPLPLGAYFPKEGSDWKGDIIGFIPVVASFTVLFLGTRNFARLFNINNITTKPWFLLLVTLGLTGLTIIIPHAPTKTPDAIFNGNSGFNMLSLTVMGFCVMHMYAVKRKASFAYAPALAWFILTILTLAVASFIFQIALMTLGDNQSFLIGIVPLMPTFIASFFLLLSAISFSTITDQSNAASLTMITARNFFGRPLKTKKTTDISSIDIDTYAASLVSEPKEINSILDEVRMITAAMQPGTPVAPQDENRLLNVYLQIEQYLLTKETVRAFTKETLRQTIANGLRLTGIQNNFWNKLPT